MVLGLPDIPGVTLENVQLPLTCPKLEQAGETVTPVEFAVFRPSRFKMTWLELFIPAETSRIADGFANTGGASATNVRVVDPLFDWSATEVAVRVTVTGVEDELAG